MNIKKITALLSAMAICANTAVCVSAEENRVYNVRSVISSKEFDYQSWNWDYISEGTNTVTLISPKDSKGEYSGLKGIGMLAIDLEDCYFDIGTVRVDSIKVDGRPLDFDPSAIVYGANDGEDNDNFRIELFNSFGETKDRPPFDASSVNVNEKVEVTFTFSTEGYSGGTREFSGSVVEKKKSNSPQPITGFNVKIGRYTENRSPVFDSSIKCDITGNKFTADLERGHYDVSISKEGYVERVIRNVPAGKRVPSELSNVDLRVFGDINGDGAINVTDISSAAAYVKRAKSFSEEYQSEVADCSHDGKVNVADISAIAAAVKGIRKIK